MSCNIPGFPIHHQLPELAQIHVEWVSDVIQLSQALLFSSPAFNLSSIRVFFLMSQFFTSSGQSIAASALASVLLMNIQGWFPLGFTDLFALLFKWLARVCSNTTVQKHQFFNTQLSLWSDSHMHTWLLEKQYFWPDRHFLAKWCLCFLICCLVLSYIFFKGTNVF